MLRGVSRSATSPKTQLVSHCSYCREKVVLQCASPAVNRPLRQSTRSACGANRRRTSSLAARSQGTDTSPGIAPELREAVVEFLGKHKVVLFMKGTKMFPQCGFSNTCVQVLNMMNVPYETVNILEDESLRSGMKEFSQWPTFPQLYIDSEFVGGCDIVIESYQNGELQEMLEVALSS